MPGNMILCTICDLLLVGTLVSPDGGWISADGDMADKVDLCVYWISDQFVSTYGTGAFMMLVWL